MVIPEVEKKCSVTSSSVFHGKYSPYPILRPNSLQIHQIDLLSYSGSMTALRSMMNGSQ